MARNSDNLLVRGESVQVLYGLYRSEELVANRRYQRKLVWSQDEKAIFIDSLLNNMPVPLILVAEVGSGVDLSLEVIDGLQRLNAVFSFIENEYPIPGADGGYFDLSSLAETKQLMDNHELTQRNPVLDRSKSVRIARYALPVSTFRSESNKEVEEVFRRINSNGRHLSGQEIRQAGSLSPLASCVRKISEAIRGDFSISDKIPLARMPEISVSTGSNGIGVNVDSIFWVRHKILEKGQVRASRDEEIVADLVVSMTINPLPPYDSRVLDEFYGLLEGSEPRMAEVSSAIARFTPEEVHRRFDVTLANFREIFDDRHPFNQHFFNSPKARVPRYFESVFMALYRVVFEDGKSILDSDAIRSDLKGFGSNHLDIPSGGGTWTRTSKDKNIGVVAGVIGKHAAKAESSIEATPDHNAIVVERYLKAAAAEAARIEFKQGFSRLSTPPRPDERVITQVAETAIGMANLGPGVQGFIIVGVADTAEDNVRVEKLLKKESPVVAEHGITGLEVDYMTHKNLDKLLLWVSSKLQAIELDARVRDFLLRDCRVARVRGRDVLLYQIRDVGEPVTFENRFYTRSGPMTVEVKGADIGALYAKFQRSL